LSYVCHFESDKVVFLIVNSGVKVLLFIVKKSCHNNHSKWKFCSFNCYSDYIVSFEWSHYHML